MRPDVDQARRGCSGRERRGFDAIAQDLLRRIDGLSPAR
jgi:hypothetical protein